MTNQKQETYLDITGLSETMEKLMLEKNQRDKLIEKVEKTGRKVTEEIRTIKKAMLEGERLENPFEDYSIYHFGVKYQEEEPKVREFVSDIEKFQNQLILENNVGHNWSSSAIGVNGQMEKGYGERKIFLGRLDEKGWEITQPYRGLVAVTKGHLKEFTTTSGWRNCSNNENISLKGYHHAYNPDDSTQDVGFDIRLFDEDKTPFFLTKKEDGFIINVGTALRSPMMFGSSITYDKEPHQTLIVGDGAVRRYLEEQNLEVKIEKTEKVVIPKI